MPSLAGRRKSLAGALAASLAGSLAIIASGNAAPVVDAGADAEGTVGVAVNIDCDATDDGNPVVPGAISYQWSYTGTGACTFGNDEDDSTTITCNANGAYTVSCTVSDGLRERVDSLTLTLVDSEDCDDLLDADDRVCLTDILAQVTSEGFTDPEDLVPADVPVPDCDNTTVVVTGSDAADTVADIETALGVANQRVVVTTTAIGGGCVDYQDNAGFNCVYWAPGTQSDGVCLADFSNGATDSAHDVYIAGGDHDQVEALDDANNVVIAGAVIFQRALSGSAITLQGATNVAIIDSIIRGQNGLIADQDGILAIGCNTQSERNSGVNDWPFRFGGINSGVIGGHIIAGGNFLVRDGMGLVRMGFSDVLPLVAVTLWDVGNTFATHIGGKGYNWNVDIWFDPTGTIDPNGGLPPEAVAWYRTHWHFSDNGFTTATLDGLESGCDGTPCLAYAADHAITLTDEGADADLLDYPAPPEIVSAALIAISGVHASLGGYADGHLRFVHDGDTYEVSDPRQLTPSVADADVGSDETGTVGVAFTLEGSCTHETAQGLSSAQWVNTAGDGDCTIDEDTNYNATTGVTTTTAVCGTADDQEFTLTCSNGLIPDEDTHTVTVESGDTFVLDGRNATVHGAWSVADRLSESHTDHLLRIERLSDNQESNIGCDGATAGTCDSGTTVDVGAIESFCALTSCRVVDVQDQSGNDRDMTQATAANRPLIYTGGAVIVRGIAGLPAFYCDGQNEGSESDGTWLHHGTSIGFTGNVNVVGWHDYQHDDDAGSLDSQDKFVWSIGNIGGSGFGFMTSQANGGRISISTHDGDAKDFANPSAQTWGFYQTEWTASGTHQTSVARRNDTALTVQDPGDTGTMAITNTRTRWCTSTFANGWFNAYGWASTLIIVDANDVDDTAAYAAHFAARL